MRRCLAVKARRRLGEPVRRLLADRGAIDRSLSIEASDEHLYIPLSRPLGSEEVEELRRVDPEVQVVEREFRESPRRPRSLVEALNGVLEPSLLAALPRSFDIIGDIAIIELPPELEPYAGVVAEALMKVHSNVKAVYSKAGSIEGEYRLRPLRHVGGEPRAVTLHREYGCSFKVDVASVYFSPRLSTERQRVARQVEDGEVVVDMFAGVGPFAIQIARRRRVKVYAIDVNPRAYELLVENIRLNRVEGLVEPIHGDASEVVRSRLRGVATRVIMNHPSQAREFIASACEALREGGGVVHYYTFASSVDEAEGELLDGVERAGRRVVEVTYSGPVREVAPRRWQMVVDAKVA